MEVYEFFSQKMTLEDIFLELTTSEEKEKTVETVVIPRHEDLPDPENPDICRQEDHQ